METTKYKTFEDIKVGDTIYQVVTANDADGITTKIENIHSKVVDITFDVRGMMISMDVPNKTTSEFILIAKGEYGYCAKLWNNKIYCSDKRNADVEIMYKRNVALDSIEKRIRYLESIKLELEKE